MLYSWLPVADVETVDERLIVDMNLLSDPNRSVDVWDSDEQTQEEADAASYCR